MLLLDNLNYLTLAVFAPILILVGILGFAIPAGKALTSGAAPYNYFHIAFGVIGAILVLGGFGAAIRAFNIGFGLIDLYQAVASRTGWFPKAQFQWTRVDDGLHLVVGTLLVAIGVFGR
jgi:hypothetical protein